MPDDEHDSSGLPYTFFGSSSLERAMLRPNNARKVMNRGERDIIVRLKGIL